MGILTGLTSISRELFEVLEKQDKFEEFIDLYEGWKELDKASFKITENLDNLRRTGLDKSYYDLNYVFVGYGNHFSENRYLLKRYNERFEHKHIDGEYISPENIVYLLDDFRVLVQDTFKDIIKSDKEFDLVRISEYGKHKIIDIDEIDYIFTELNKLAYKYLESLDDPDDWWCDDGPMSDYIDYLGPYSREFIKFLTESVYQKNENNKIEFKYEAVIICSS